MSVRNGMTKHDHDSLVFLLSIYKIIDIGVSLDEGSLLTFRHEIAKLVVKKN